MTLTYLIENEFDNGEFLTSCDLVYCENGHEVSRETYYGSTEFAPGYTAITQAVSAGQAWLDVSSAPLDEQLGPYGLEWQREQAERYEAAF